MREIISLVAQISNWDITRKVKLLKNISLVALVGPLWGCRSRAVRTLKFFQEKIRMV